MEQYNVKERKASKNIRNRKSSLAYYLTLSKEDGVQIKAEVCKKTFLSVTGFREKINRVNAVRRDSKDSKEDEGTPTTSKQRGMSGSRGESYTTDKEFMVHFFNKYN